MRTLKWFIPLLLSALFSACGGSGSADPEPETDTMASARVRAMEDSLYADPDFGRKDAQALLDVYLAYAKVHPLDSLTPEYLFRGASLRTGLDDPQGGIALYDRIIHNYPGWRKIPDTYYLKAFTIDNSLHQKGEAKLAYQQVIDKFPEHRFAKDAAQMIKNLQYTDQQLMERFEAMNADSAHAEVTGD